MVAIRLWLVNLECVGRKMSSEEIKYAGFWRRLLAIIIDAIILFLPLLVLNIVLIKIAGFSETEGWVLKDYFTRPLLPEHTLILSLISQFIATAIIAKFYLIKWQATPGKRIAKIYVGNKDGSKLSLKNAILRAALPFIIVAVYNIASFGLLNLYLDNAKVKYQHIIEEFFPDIKQMAAQSNTDFDNYIKTPEAKKLLEGKVGALSQEQRMIFISSIRSAFIDENMAMYSRSLSVSFLIILSLWFLMIGRTKEKTAMHDIILNTRAFVGRR